MLKKLDKISRGFSDENEEENMIKHSKLIQLTIANEGIIIRTVIGNFHKIVLLFVNSLVCFVEWINMCLL